MKQVFKYLKPYRAQCVLAPAFKLLEAAFELFVPLVIAALIDRGLGNGDMSFVLKCAGLLLILALVGFACAVTAQYFSAVTATGFGCATSGSLFRKIQSLSYSQLDSMGTSGALTRLTGDVTAVQTGVNLTLRLLLRSPFVVLGAFLMAALIDLRLSLIIGGVILALGAVVAAIMYFTVRRHRVAREATDATVSTVRENLTGVRVLRAFCREGEETRSFEEKNKTLTGALKGAGRVSALTGPLTYVIVNLGVVLLIHRGALRVEMGDLTQGQVVALYNYMSQILVELVKLASLIVTVTKAIAGAGRISEVLEMEPAMTYPETQPQTDADAPHLTFRGVTATYEGAAEPSLEGVSFSIERGQTLGVIGGTGSGKTTLVNLIPRFYDVTCGEVLLSGASIKDYPRGELRHKIAVVPQGTRLFRGTVRDNLLWGNPDATDEELYAALRTAQMEKTVREKGGLDAPISQGGRNLSGGQRQRLTVARALVGRPELLILDDSASALDYATDAALRHALREDLGGTTVVVVSQRAASVRHSDLILVLDDGQVVGQGTHKELLEGCETYREICHSQELLEKEAQA